MMKIQRSFKSETSTGSLYLVPTPIGNLDDMTFRAVKSLSDVDLIAAEDTRNTQKLLNHFEIHTPQVSFHEHNWAEKIPQLLELLSAGKSIAQVSDAGMPSISDPGHELVEAAIAADIPVIALPGPSAGLTALIASGISPQPHVFYGFLPRKRQQQLAFFEEKKDVPETQIFYESPHRVADTLENMLEIYGDRQAALVRELTKIYEEYRRGSLAELLSALTENPVKGECLIIVEGQKNPVSSDAAEGTAVEAVQLLVSQGTKPNEAIKKVAKARGLNRQALYAEFHAFADK